MDFPIIELACNKCGDRQTGGGFPSMEYVHGERRVPVLTKESWCHDCNALRHVERLDPSDWRARIEHVMREIASAREESGLFKKRITHQYLYLDDGWRFPLGMNSLTSWRERLQAALDLQILRASRRSPPRCLTCGKTNVFPKELMHPNCGGLYESQNVGSIHVKAGSPRWVSLFSLDGEYCGRELRSPDGDVLEQEMADGARKPSADD